MTSQPAAWLRRDSVSSIAICPAEYGGFGLTFEWETARFGIAKRQLLKFPLRTVARRCRWIRILSRRQFRKTFAGHPSHAGGFARPTGPAGTGIMRLRLSARFLLKSKIVGNRSRAGHRAWPRQRGHLPCRFRAGAPAACFRAGIGGKRRFVKIYPTEIQRLANGGIDIIPRL